uniref:UDP-glucuronosyltransferase n=1 Tax=Syphacia muris TaxID=451379 RepID=A0A0N5ASW3_9BILA
MYSYSSDNMNIYERMWNLINSRIAEMYHESIYVREQQVFNQLYGKDFEKIANSAFLFVNTNPLYDFPRPTLPKIIPVGGINVKKPKPLSKEWLSILEQRLYAITVAFGSAAKSSAMPKQMKQALLKAFAQFPNVTFVWRYEKAENIAKGYSNVVVADWIPQNDLLNDDRVIGAVTHCGINTIHEGVQAGKPLILVPLFAEQSRNAKMVERAKIGIILEKSDLYYETKIAAFVKVCISTFFSMRENAKQLSLMVQSNPEDVHQKVVQYVEFAAKFNGLPLLDNSGRKQSVFVYYFLDIALLFVMIYIVLLAFILYLCKGCIVSLLGLEIRCRRFHKKHLVKINKKQE